MEQNWSEQIMNIINQIAEKLGVAAEKLYPILKKQAMVDGVLNIFYVLISIGILFIIYKAIKYCYFTKDKNGYTVSYNWELAHFGFWSVCIIFFIFSIVSIVIDFRDIITAFLNPDWYIINNILSRLIK